MVALGHERSSWRHELSFPVTNGSRLSEGARLLQKRRDMQRNLDPTGRHVADAHE